MAQQRRSLSVAMVVMLLSVLLMPFVPASALTSPAVSFLAQDDEGDAGDEAVIDLQLDRDLGNGGQPDDYPREIVVDGEHYLYDRPVPDLGDRLAEIDTTGDFTVWGTGEDASPARYLQSGSGPLARYLPEFLTAPETACPAEDQAVGRFEANGNPYVFAGVETDLTPDDLEEVGTAEDQPVYAEPGAADPFPELFLGDPDGLLRFVALIGEGRPASLDESLVLRGTVFPVVGDVTDQIDTAELTKVACAGPFAAYTAADETAVTYVIVGNQVLAFEGTLDAAAATPNPTAEQAIEPGEPPAASPTPPATPTVEAATPTLEQPEATPPPPTAEMTPTEAAATATMATPTANATLAPTVTATDAPAATAPPAPATSPPMNAATPGLAGSPPATPVSAAAANLPEQIEVQNTAYSFQAVATDIDRTTLVQVETVTVNDVTLTIYARQEVQGVAPQLYVVTADGQAVGQYVPVAASQPDPPAELPRFVEIEGSSYLFNETETTIDIQSLTVIQTIVVQNVEVTVYVEQGVEGQPARVFLITADGQVAGQYVVSSVVAASAPPTPAPSPTAPPEPAAVVPTLPPGVQPPAVATAPPSSACTGDPGATNAAGLPDRLPNRLQYRGVAYTFAQAVNAGDAGQLTTIGCAGPFELASTDQAGIGEVLYLRVSGQTDAAAQVYRFQAAPPVQVEIERTDRPQVLMAGDQRFRLTQAWLPGLYSSTSVRLFTLDPENPAPEAIYAVDIRHTVIGEVIAEYRLPGEISEPSAAMIEAAQNAGINPDLTVGGTRYILVNMYYPAGTSANGFLTVYSAAEEGFGDILLGRDSRFDELYVYQREG